jgi:hypothetical protein
MLLDPICSKPSSAELALHPPIGQSAAFTDCAGYNSRLGERFGRLLAFFQVLVEFQLWHLQLAILALNQCFCLPLPARLLVYFQGGRKEHLPAHLAWHRTP